MIITITGKPCSGKGEASKVLCQKYGFEYISAGSVFRKAAMDLGFESITDFTMEEYKKVDKLVDSNLIKIGETRINENLLIDSRLAWHFIPKSFKVYLDIDWLEAGRRLVGANRDSEFAEDVPTAIKKLKHRWNMENVRYQELYGIDNLHKENYDLVINTKNKTPEQIAQLIYDGYVKYTK